MSQGPGGGGSEVDVIVTASLLVFSALDFRRSFAVEFNVASGLKAFCVCGPFQLKLLHRT